MYMYMNSCKILEDEVKYRSKKIYTKICFSKKIIEHVQSPPLLKPVMVVASDRFIIDTCILSIERTWNGLIRLPIQNSSNFILYS